MKAYADSVGTTTNFQTIIDSAMANNSEAPSRPTANNYREALQILYIIDEVPSFLPFGKLYPNSGKSPKYFMLNPAIVLSLLNVSREQLENYQILKHIGKLNQSFIDQLLESLVYQSLIVYADANAAKLSQFRDSRWTKEIDFILQKGNSLILFEVKADPVAQDAYVTHLNWFEAIAEDGFSITKVLLNTGPFSYTREDGVHVIPIALLGVWFSSNYNIAVTTNCLNLNKQIVSIVRNSFSL